MRPIALMAALLATAAIAACGDNATIPPDAAPPVDAAPAIDAQTAFKPAMGAWLHRINEDSIDTECRFSPTLRTINWLSEPFDDGVIFVQDWTEATPALTTCTHDRQTFGCEPVDDTTERSDYVITRTTTMTGTITSATTMLVDNERVQTCVGDGCDGLVTPFPCTTTWQSELRLYEQGDVEADDCALEAELKADDVSQQSFIDFINESDEVRRVYVLDFDGERQLFSTLNPGSRRHILSFITHPFVVTNEADECVALFQQPKYWGLAHVP